MRKMDEFNKIRENVAKLTNKKKLEADVDQNPYSDPVPEIEGQQDEKTALAEIEDIDLQAQNVPA